MGIVGPAYKCAKKIHISLLFYSFMRQAAWRPSHPPHLFAKVKQSRGFGFTPQAHPLSTTFRAKVLNPKPPALYPFSLRYFRTECWLRSLLCNAQSRGPEYSTTYIQIAPGRNVWRGPLFEFETEEGRALQHIPARALCV